MMRRLRLFVDCFLVLVTDSEVLHRGHSDVSTALDTPTRPPIRIGLHKL